MTDVLEVPTLLATIDIVRTQGPSGRWHQLCAKGFLKNLPSIGVEGCVLRESRTTVVPPGVSSFRPGLSLPLFVILLLTTRLSPSLVSKLAQLLQLHELGGLAPQFVQAFGRLHTQAICKRTRSEGRKHVVHRHIRTQVLNAHGDLPKLVDELPQRLPFHLANTDLGDGRQVMGPTGSELDVKLGHLRLKVDDGELGGSFVNQLKAPPFREVGKTRYRTASSVVYKLV